MSRATDSAFLPGPDLTVVTTINRSASTPGVASLEEGGGLTARNSITRYLSITPKDEMYAIIGVVGEEVAFDQQYTAILLTSMAISPQERSQIDETFENSIIYFGDKAPEVYRFAGNLINAMVESPADSGTFNWRDAFLISYENTFRGTKCVEHKQRLFIDMDDLVIVGYMMGAPVMQNSQETAPSVSFDIFVTDVRFKNPGGGAFRHTGG